MLNERLTRQLGSEPIAKHSLSGGITPVYRVTLADGRQVVVKQGHGLDIEGFMLSFLAEHSNLPVPAVIFSDADLLVMEYIACSGRLTVRGQLDAAEHIAALHRITGPQFGLHRDTLIGGLPQPNPLTATWIDFFREQRLLYMAHEAAQSGRLPASFLHRVERLAAQLDYRLDEPEKPALLHGDLWAGNILSDGDRIAAFIDPAIYYGHPEIELAFITLFNAFDAPFFRRYAELRPIADGFFEERRDLYNLYPLLVHVRLFGGGYVGAVERILRRFGC
jgi:fructosamine-3-kinase